MKKNKMKLAGLLLAIACVSCGAGGVVAGTTAVNNNVVVQAEETGEYTPYELGVLTVHGHSAGTTTNKPSATALYMKSAITLPFTTWDDKFNLESGNGFKLNGNDVTTGQLVSADKSLYVNLANANVQVGDVLTVSGTFVHVSQPAKYVIEESAFIWTGFVWTKYAEPTTYEIGRVAIDGGSSATAVNFKKASGKAFEVKDGSWAEKLYFIDGTGVGVTFNGTQLKGTDFKIPNNIYLGLEGKTAVAGDEIVIGGTFFNGTLKVKYVIEETKFVFDGTAWNAVVEYTTYNVTKIKAASSGCSATEIQVLLTSDKELPAGDWDNVYTFEAGSGTGLTLGDTTLTTTDIKYPGSFYVGFKATAAEGDVLTIDGTYYNETTALKFVFDNCKLQYKEGAWVEYVETPVVPEEPEVPETEYQEVSIGRLGLKSSSSEAASAHSQRIYMKTDGNSNFIGIEGVDEYEVTYVSGTHVLLNGEACAYSRCRVSAGGDQFYLKITVGGQEVGANVGDKVTFGGVYVSETYKIKYTIEDSDFWWNGTAWQTEAYQAPEEPEVQYTVYELGEMVPHANSVSLNNPRATQLYMKRADGQALPYAPGTWDHKFALESGDGWKLNGNSVTVGNLISTDAGLYVDITAAGVKVGDVLTVSGTFTYEAAKAKYVISESKFTWNGAAWEKYVYVEYTTHEVGSLIFMKWTAASNHIYLGRADGKSFPIPDDNNGGWTAVFTCKSGVGVTLNGTPVKEGGMKFPNALFINIYEAPKEGDILTVGGTFFNSTCAIEYVVTETSFKWDGTTWVLESSEEPSVEYTTYTVTKVGASADSKADVVYLYSLEGDALPKDKGDWDIVYSYGTGASVKLNDTAIAATIKMPGDLYVPLGVEAKEGDIFTINGTFYNEAKAIKLVFNNCKLQYNSEGKWVAYEGTDTPVTPPTPTEWQTLSLGMLTVHNHSSGATSNVPKATALYIKSASVKEYLVNSWSAYFTLESGDGWKLNGESFTPTEFINADKHLYINLKDANVQVGDKLTVSGTFVYEAGKVRYTIEESTFIWNGTIWENYIEYTTYELGSLKFAKFTVGSNHVYLTRVDGKGITPPSDGNNGWTATFKWKDGVGITLNDVELGMSNRVKMPHEFFIALPMAPEKGDILKVGGTFYNEECVCQYIVEESVFEWDGTTWIPILEYTEYEVDGLSISGTQSSTTFIDLEKADGASFEKEGTYKFKGGSGVGVALNRELVETTSITVSSSKLMVSLTPAAEEGMVLTIGGTFYNVETATQYIIDECSFIYENGVWNAYESDYEEIGVGEVKIIEEASNEQILYFTSKNESVVIPDVWDDEFICTDGIGITLNGQAVEAIIYSGDNAICVELAMEAQEGDVLVIGGKFVCDGAGVLYYVKDSQFTWDGEAWEGVINYQTINLGKLTLFGNSNTTDKGLANTLHFKAAKGMVLADFELTFESGIGFTVNGEAREFTIKNLKDGAGYLYFKFADVANGDIVKIGGTFYNKETATKYVIDESTFIWNDAWSVKCETVNVGTLTMVTRDSNARDLYLIPSNISITLPVADWEQGAFRFISGIGITVNGEQVDLTNNWKSVGGNTMFVRLTSDTAGVEEGSIVVIEGTFRSDLYGYEYIFEETSFIYENGSWRNLLDDFKTEKMNALDAYAATFVESDYYESEWALIQTIVSEAKAEINLALSKATVEELLAAAKATMDEVATKADVDTNFPQWKEDAKAELETYKDVTLYRESEQATIASTVAQAKTDIDACANWAEFNKIVVEAKAVMDALWTDAQWTAAEEVVTAALDELASYKSEEDYKAAQWASIQSIIAQAYVDINDAIGNTSVIEGIVATAKATMDMVKTAEQVEAEELAILAVKAELESYKTQGDYNEPEWNEIQAILANAYTRLDQVIGDDEAIATIVADAKAAMDKVLKSEEANAKAFADAKYNAEQEIRNYVDGLNYELYSDAAMEEINGYVTAAMDAIEAVTSAEGFAPIVADMKAKIEKVEKLVVDTPDSGVKPAFGCGSVVGATTGLTLLAGAAAVALRKKKEND
ncbi:MAG: hypothetical protein E7371_05330 [Clostridiales bacterium]|nr:hypothetical protein [Clostridiales bacterium]